MSNKSLSEYMKMQKTDSLAEVASVIGCSVEQLQQWRDQSPAISTGPPYEIGAIAFDLLAENCMTIEQLGGADVPGLSEPLRAMGAHIITGSIRAAEAGNIAENLYEDPALRQLMQDGDPDRLLEGIRMTGGVKRKQWKPLDSRESVAIAISKPKCASLFFDRIWTLDREVPGSVGIRLGTFKEKVALGLIDGIIEKLAALETDDTRREERLERMDKVLTSSEIELPAGKAFAAMLSPDLQELTSRPVQAYYESDDTLKGVYEIGSTPMIVASLESLEWVNESELTWDHVCSVREDSDAIRQLKRMLHWLDSDMEGKPLSFIQDEISLRIDEYQDAVRKHGLRLAKGAFGTFLDVKLWNTLFGTLAGCAFDKNAAPYIGVAVALTLQSTRVVFETMNLNRELKSTLDASPVAYLHRVKRLSSDMST